MSLKGPYDVLFATSIFSCTLMSCRQHGLLTLKTFATVASHTRYIAVRRIATSRCSGKSSGTTSLFTRPEPIRVYLRQRGFLPPPSFCSFASFEPGNIATMTSTSPDLFRLPTNVKPVHYDVTVRTDLEAQVFQGFVKIRYVLTLVNSLSHLKVTS